MLRQSDEIVAMCLIPFGNHFRIIIPVAPKGVRMEVSLIPVLRIDGWRVCKTHHDNSNKKLSLGSHAFIFLRLNFKVQTPQFINRRSEIKANAGMLKNSYDFGNLLFSPASIKLICLPTGLPSRYVITRISDAPLGMSSGRPSYTG